jgi:hypothetical protein
MRSCRRLSKGAQVLISSEVFEKLLAKPVYFAILSKRSCPITRKLWDSFQNVAISQVFEVKNYKKTSKIEKLQRLSDD